MKKEELKELINAELERTKLKWHARIWSHELKKHVNINDYILNLLTDFGTRKIQALKFDFETIKATLSYTCFTLDINIIVIINDSITYKIPAKIFS